LKRRLRRIVDNDNFGLGNGLSYGASQRALPELLPISDRNDDGQSRLGQGDHIHIQLQPFRKKTASPPML
jgi:hypothetical protein